MIAVLVLAAARAAEPAAPSTGIVGCSAAVAAQALDADLEPLERAYAEATAAGVEEFGQRLARLREALPCVGELLTPTQAARVHRVFGLDAWLHRADTSALPARAYFATARHLDPAYVFPEWLAGPQDPERREYDAALVGLEGAAAEPARTGLASVVDGAPDGLRHPDWPAILQWTSADSDRVRCTEYLSPGAPSRCAVALGAPITAVQRKRARSVGLMVAGAALGGGGVALELVNLGRRSELGMDKACADVLEGEPDSTHDCGFSEGHLRELDTVSTVESAAAIALMALGGAGLIYGGVTLFVSPDGVMASAAFEF